MEFQAFIFLYIIVIFSSIIHEYSHGWVAYVLGDPTAKNQGRLTLNPLAHIDPWGTILMPFLIMIISSFSIFFGYAKPVPFNPYNLKNQKRDTMLIALAGPLSNLAIALILGLLVRFSIFPLLNDALSFVVLINIWFMLFNLLPFAPADGSKILAGILPYPWSNNLLNLNPFVGISVALMVAFWVLPWAALFLVRLIIGA